MHAKIWIFSKPFTQTYFFLTVYFEYPWNEFFLWSYGETETAAEK